MSQIERLKYLDYAKVLTIIMVVINHSFHIEAKGDLQGLYDFCVGLCRMANFRMSSFMFVTGFLFWYIQEHKREKETYRNSIAKRFKRLILPVLVFSTIAFVPRAMMSVYADESVTFSWSRFLNSFLYDDQLVIPFYWFAISCFWLWLFAFVVVRFVPPKRMWVFYVVMLPICLACNEFHLLTYIKLLCIGNTIHYSLYFFLGMFCATYRSSIMEKILNNSLCILVCSAASWWLLAYYKPTYVPVAFRDISGILMLLSISRQIELREIHVFDHLTDSVMAIYLLMWFPNVLCQQVLHGLTGAPWWVCSILSMVTAIYVPHFIRELRKKITPHEVLGI